MILSACGPNAPQGTEPPVGESTDFPAYETPTTWATEPGMVTTVESTGVDAMETSPAPLETGQSTAETTARATMQPTVERTQEPTRQQGLPSTGNVDPGLVSNLLNFGVYTRDGEHVGQTEDLILNTREKNIEYLLVNMDGKLIAVPWSLVSIVPAGSGTGTGTGGTGTGGTGSGGTSVSPSATSVVTTPGSAPALTPTSSTGTGGTGTGTGTSTGTGPQNDFRINIDRATLEKAPTFERGAFPDTQKMDWDAAIRAYWKTFMTGTMQETPGANPSATPGMNPTATP